MVQKERKKLKKKLDTLWSKLVKDKANNTCERCFSQAKQLNAHHWIGRRCMATRYLLENSSCLCVGCHFWVHENPISASDWIKGKRGENWHDRLLVMKQITKTDLKMVEIQLKEAEL